MDIEHWGILEGRREGEDVLPKLIGWKEDAGRAEILPDIGEHFPCRKLLLFQEFQKMYLFYNVTVQ